MVAFVAQQIGVNPGALAEYGRRDTSRREHAAGRNGISACTRPSVRTGGRH
jgi:hypothetical protein